MTAEQYGLLVEEDAKLAAGIVVQVNWTNNGRYLTAKATVEKVNAKSVVVRLNEHVAPDFYGGWPVGQRIRVPRITEFRLWTENNCARLLPV